MLIQRSFGYAWRPTLHIAESVLAVKRRFPRCVCFADNCYGEFVENREPVHPDVGADLMASSLIKNLGGGIVACGGYVAGRGDLVQRARMQLTAPGVGGGATLGCKGCCFRNFFWRGELSGRERGFACWRGYGAIEAITKTAHLCDTNRDDVVNAPFFLSRFFRKIPHMWYFVFSGMVPMTKVTGSATFQVSCHGS